MLKSITLRRLCSLLAVVTLLAACGGSGNEAQSEDNEETIAQLREIERGVMEVHDEVMPKMSELNNIMKRLKGVAENADAPEEARQGAQTAVQNLVDADSLMWDWMYNYSRPNYEGDLDSARMYLTSEMERVTVVKESMLSSMERGEALLESLKDK